MREPVIDASPFLLPSHSAVAVTPVKPDPFPTNEPENTEADTVELIVKCPVEKSPNIKGVLLAALLI